MSPDIWAIDPGTDLSAYVVIGQGKLKEFGKVDNFKLLERIKKAEPGPLAIEMIASFGLPVGNEVFQTCLWIGRFVQAWNGPHDLIFRRQVKIEFCNTIRAKDGNVRQAIMDLYGGSRAVGTKHEPGPLYGVTKDVWQALAVAIYFKRKQSGTLQSVDKQLPFNIQSIDG